MTSSKPSLSTKSDDESWEHDLTACLRNKRNLQGGTSEHDLYIHGHGPRHIPRVAKSPSSNRCRLSTVVSKQKLDASSNRSRKNKCNVAKKKRKKQAQHLFPIVPRFILDPSDVVDKNCFTYIDGGGLLNPPISPPRTDAKQTKVLSIRNNDLKVITSHLSHPEKGLIYRRDDKTPSDIVLVPRKYSLAHMQRDKRDAISLCDALDEVEIKVKTSQERGISKSVIREPNNKYICVGNQTNRGGVGIRRYHRAILDSKKHVSDRIMRYFRAVEHLFSMFMDTEEIRIVHDAIELMKAETFAIPKNFPSKNDKSCDDRKQDRSSNGGMYRKKSAIYGAFASGVNVYLSAHIDKDFTYCATSIHRRSEYHEEDSTLAYFAFPRLGIAIPLRAGDVLFFNPTEPHCVSSRVNNDDEIYCVSLYLKSDNIGKNNNSLALTPEEDFFLGYYHDEKKA
jgi:hypothetical protein